MEKKPMVVDNKNVARLNALSVLIVGLLLVMTVFTLFHVLLALIFLGGIPFLSYWFYRRSLKQVCFYKDRIEVFQNYELIQTIFPPFEEVEIRTLMGNPKIGKQDIAIRNGNVQIGIFVAENVNWEFEKLYHFTTSQGIQWNLGKVYNDFYEEYNRFLKIIEARERKNR